MSVCLSVCLPVYSSSLLRRALPVLISNFKTGEQPSSAEQSAMQWQQPNSGSAEQPVSIRHGHDQWREFCECTGLNHYPDGVVVFFDQHNVVDTMTFDEACDTGTSLDHIENVNVFICSYGRDHREETYSQEVEWCPMVAECDGYIFTDYCEGYYQSIDVYRDDWMEPNTIGVKGDKGQIAKLMNKPVLLFDDREDNIERLRQRSSADAYLDGVVVRRGTKAHRRVNPGFVIENNCNEWINIVRRFAEDPDSFKRLPQRTH